MPAGQRAGILNRLADLTDGERGLVANARCLGEGVDVPALDGIAFVDPRSSQLDIIQAVGRVMRRSPEKKIGTIVLPVFIAPEKDAEAALNGSDFKPVWTVLRALRAHDDILGETLDNLRRQLGEQSGTGEVVLPDKLVLDLPITIDESFANALRLKAIKRSTALPVKWEEAYACLKGFAAFAGHARVPFGYVTKPGYKLGVWVNTQHVAYRQGQLSQRRIEQLENVEGWIWRADSSANRVTGAEYLERLRDYVKCEGHTVMSKDYTTEDGCNLGDWVARQRSQWWSSDLSRKREHALEEVPEWTWDYSGLKWTDGLECTRKYMEKQGHTNVPRKYVTPDGMPLGEWIFVQQVLFGYGKMTTNHQRELEEIPGWVWDPTWDHWMTRLRLFVIKWGHTLVSVDFCSVSDFPLVEWVDYYRKRYVIGTVSRSQRDMLDRLPGWTETCLALAERQYGHAWLQERCAPSWVKGYKLLRTYAEREGHTFVPRHCTTPDGYLLGRWVSDQRSPDSKRRLSPQQRRLLEKLPGWVWGASEVRHTLLGGDFEIGFADFWQGNIEKGNAYFRQYVDSKGKLVAKSYLKRTGYWSEGTSHVWLVRWAQFYQGIAHFRQYVESKDNVRVAKDYVDKYEYRLGQWAHFYHQEYLQDRLSPKVVWLLEQLPGWTWHEQTGLTAASNSDISASVTDPYGRAFSFGKTDTNGPQTEVKKQLQPLLGRLKLDGRPGLEVYKSGRRLGQANEWIDLPVGDHDLELRCRNYRTERITITIPPNRPVLMQSPAMVAESGAIRVSVRSTISQDDYLNTQQAKIRIDGGKWRLVDLPFAEEDLSCETHRVELHVQDYDSPQAQSIEIRDSQTSNVTFQLAPKTGTVTVSSGVSEAEVFEASGNKLGCTGKRLQLSPFITHCLTVKAPKCKTAAVTVRLGQPGAHGGTKSVTLEEITDITPRDPWFIPDLGMVFAYVAPGHFQMGSNDGNGSEEPVHMVRISQGYWMGKHEVTQQQYQSITKNNPSRSKGHNKPVEFVSWCDAVSFCQKLTDQERRAGRLPKGHEYRLPTEAEWEYAARGGSCGRNAQYAGSNTIGDVAWYKDNNRSTTHPVGQKKANELGLYDMSGNVCEWCHDWYEEYDSSSQTDPAGPDTGSERVYRGGSWCFNASSCRVASRYYGTPTLTYYGVGFRVVLASPVRR